MKFNVFGKNIEVIEHNAKWIVFYIGNEGKKRLADDIFIHKMNLRITYHFFL